MSGSVLKEDNDLLNLMLNDANKQAPIYRPGPYWLEKTKNTVREIKRAGIKNFRGDDNLVGMSFTDNFNIDIRNFYRTDFKRNLTRKILTMFPFRSVFTSQVSLTRDYAEISKKYAAEILKSKSRGGHLLDNYKINNTTNAGCLNKVELRGNSISLHYLDLLDQHDYVAQKIDFNRITSMMEIGGGFGANVHLLLENYKNIKKIIYLDIPPNLYIGTQYLKSIYGNSVVDYSELSKKDSIQFSDDNKLEILCIAPWQIEQLKSHVNFFTNMHSFVEMPEEIVKNYIKKFEGLPDSDKSSVALVTYDSYNPESTIVHSRLPTFFKQRDFESFEKETLLDSSRVNYFFISNRQNS